MNKFYNMTNANGCLDQWYPNNGNCIRKNDDDEINNYGKRRNKFAELNLRNHSLVGTLDLSDFVNLEMLDCLNNKLTRLILPNDTKLTELDVAPIN